MINKISLRSQVESILKEYGVTIKLYKDIYDVDELGCKTLTESMRYITDVIGVIDNSQSSSTSDKTGDNTKGIIKINSKCDMYIPFSKSSPVREDDYVEIDGNYYRTGTSENVMYYDVLTKIPLNRVEVT